MPRLPMLGDQRDRVPEPTAVHEIEMEEEEDGGEAHDDDDDMYSNTGPSRNRPFISGSPMSVDSDFEESDNGHTVPRPIPIRLRPSFTPGAFQPLLSRADHTPPPVDYFSQRGRRQESEDSDSWVLTPTPGVTTPRPTPGAAHPAMQRQRSRSMVDLTPGGRMIDLGSIPSTSGAGGGAGPSLHANDASLLMHSLGHHVPPAQLNGQLSSSQGPAQDPSTRPEFASSSSSLVPLALLQGQMLARQHDALLQGLPSPSRLASQPQQPLDPDSSLLQNAGLLPTPSQHDGALAAQLLADGVPPSMILDDLAARARTGGTIKRDATVRTSDRRQDNLEKAQGKDAAAAEETTMLRRDATIKARPRKSSLPTPAGDVSSRHRCVTLPGRGLVSCLTSLSASQPHANYLLLHTLDLPTRLSERSACRHTATASTSQRGACSFFSRALQSQRLGDCMQEIVCYSCASRSHAWSHVHPFFALRALLSSEPMPHSLFMTLTLSSLCAGCRANKNSVLRTSLRKTAGGRRCAAAPHIFKSHVLTP